MKRLSVCFLGCMVILISSFVWAETKPIIILSLVPVSPGSSQVTMAQKLAVEECNARGGLLGRKVELIVEDDQLKPEVAISKAQKHLLEGKIAAIMVTSSSTIKPLQDLTTQYNMPLVMIAHAEEATGKNFTYNSFRPAYNTAMAARATIAFAAKHLKDKKKFYLLNPDYKFGHDLAASLKRELARQIPEAQLLGEDYHPFMSKDFSVYLTKIKMSGAEVILNQSFGFDAGVLVKQRAELGVPAVVLGPGVLDPAAIRERPESSIGNCGCDTWFPTSTSKESLDFLSSWERTYKDSKEYPIPTSISARDYIAVTFLLEAIKEAGSAEPAKLIPTLETLRLRTISGDVYLRACDHQLIMPFQCVTVIKKDRPYYSAPITIPASEIMIDERDVDNPRCKRR